MLSRWLVLLKKAFLIYVWRPFRSAARTRLEVPVISIETTNICNSKCVVCANTLMRRKRQAMSLELFERIIEDYVAMGGTRLTFDTVIGEPLLDPHLLDRARVVRRHPRITENGFVTTLQWLHHHDIEEFFRSGFTWLSISTVLTGPESYRAFFGVELYAPMLDNLIRLFEKNREAERPIRITVDLKPTGEPIQKIRAHSDFRRVHALLRFGVDTLFEPATPNFVDDWLGAIKPPRYLRLSQAPVSAITPALSPARWRNDDLLQRSHRRLLVPGLRSGERADHGTGRQPPCGKPGPKSAPFGTLGRART